MIDFNSYIDGLDLSALKEYCVNHGRLTQYAKGDYFIKAGEDGENGGYPPTKDGDIRSLLCA